MFITDTMPVKVNGFVIAYDPDDKMHCGLTAKRSDMASAILVRMNNGAVVKLLQVSLRGGGVWVRIHGNKGAAENLRHGDRQMVYLRREPSDTPEGEEPERIYKPEFPPEHAKALQAGHGGGDYFVIHNFAEAIRKNEQPYMDVYRGVAMSIVGILAYRSALQDSNTLEVPDFRNKEERKAYANDDWNPDPTRRKEGYPLPSILGDIKPPAEGLAYARKVWNEIGYTGE